MKNYIYNFKNKFFCSVCIVILLAFNLISLSHIADLCAAIFFGYEIEYLWLVFSGIDLVVNIIFILLITKKRQSVAIFAIMYYIAICVVALSIVGLILTVVFVVSTIAMLKNRKPQKVITYVPQPIKNTPRICTQNTVPSATNGVILPAFCLYCGKAIVPNSKFCINCGSPTENAPAIVECSPHV